MERCLEVERCSATLPAAFRWVRNGGGSPL